MSTSEFSNSLYTALV